MMLTCISKLHQEKFMLKKKKKIGKVLVFNVQSTISLILG